MVILKGWCKAVDAHETSDLAISIGKRESTYSGDAKKIEGSGDVHDCLGSTTREGSERIRPTHKRITCVGLHAAGGWCKGHRG